MGIVWRMDWEGHTGFDLAFRGGEACAQIRLCKKPRWAESMANGRPSHEQITEYLVPRLDTSLALHDRLGSGTVVVDDPQLPYEK